MDIYITKTKSLITPTTTQLLQTSYPQNCHILIDPKTLTGMKTVEHSLVYQLIKADLENFKELSNIGTSGFILAAGNTKWTGIVPGFVADDTYMYNYKLAALTMTNIFGGRIANILGFTDMILTDSTACISGHKAIMDACLYMKYNNIDKFIIISVENGPSGELLEFFGKANASLTIKKSKEDNIVPSAFDDINHGFNLAQGINITLLETEKSINLTKNIPLCEIKSSVVGGEKSNDPMMQSIDGIGYSNVIKKSLENAMLDQNDIGLIKSHGTGTKSNNLSEYNAICSIFKDVPPITSYKPTYGHAMGASCNIEIDLILRDFKDGMISPIANCNNTKMIISPLSINTLKSKNILCLASGMGNVYSSIIIKAL